MSKLRKLHDLTEKDKGVAIVREEIRKEWDKVPQYIPEQFEKGLATGLSYALQKCDDRLDIATLGEIDMKCDDTKGEIIDHTPYEGLYVPFTLFNKVLEKKQDFNEMRYQISKKKWFMSHSETGLKVPIGDLELLEGVSEELTTMIDSSFRSIGKMIIEQGHKDE